MAKKTSDYSVSRISTGSIVAQELTRSQARALGRSDPDYVTNEHVRRSVKHGITYEPENSKFPEREYWRSGYKGEDPVEDKSKSMTSLSGVRQSLMQATGEDVVIAFYVGVDGDTFWVHSRENRAELLAFIEEHGVREVREFYSAVIPPFTGPRRGLGDTPRALNPDAIYSVVVMKVWAKQDRVVD